MTRERDRAGIFVPDVPTSRGANRGLLAGALNHQIEVFPEALQILFVLDIERLKLDG